MSTLSDILNPAFRIIDSLCANSITVGASTYDAVVSDISLDGMIDDYGRGADGLRTIEVRVAPSVLLTYGTALTYSGKTFVVKKPVLGDDGNTYYCVERR